MAGRHLLIIAGALFQGQIMAKVPLGKPASFTDAGLSQEAEIRESDIEQAVALWIRFAPFAYRSLIKSPLLGTDGAETAPFAWDPVRLQYVHKSNGLYMDPLTLRTKAVEPFLFKVKQEMQKVSVWLQTGQISLSEWQMTQMTNIKISQLAAALVANGGIYSTNLTDYAQIATFITALFLFFRKFAIEIYKGIQLMNGRIFSRTGLYASAGVDAYEEMRRYAVGVYTDMTEERRVLDPKALHCHTEDGLIGCPELAERGFQPLGTLPRIYDTPCRTNCRCHWVFR